MDRKIKTEYTEERVHSSKTMKQGFYSSSFSMVSQEESVYENSEIESNDPICMYNGNILSF